MDTKTKNAPEPTEYCYPHTQWFFYLFLCMNFIRDVIPSLRTEFPENFGKVGAFPLLLLSRSWLHSFSYEQIP